MELLNQIPSRSSSVVTRKTGNEYIIVPVTDNIADMDSIFTLNETGAFIWEQIDGEKSVEEIIRLVVDEFEIDRDTATKDVLGFLSTMKEYLIIKM
ncbi:MAG TPA: PqqD family protein [Bacteroidales bacterium]|nr:PqqD family protein [Bacteroidales bacterium]HOK73581.1 PqqD family protein [Bacteroidales bacterium]HOM41722.1 PqqD family protein [Bacteroidales bacterium]HOU30554.1 PqqD family protein [Bacteroidales bacterium]HPP92171.1 PqqD family protein [Bacteroidales bacterium]